MWRSNDFFSLFCRVREFRRFSEKSDAYSFGIFLLELVSGHEAMDLLSSELNVNIVEWVYMLSRPIWCIWRLLFLKCIIDQGYWCPDRQLSNSASYAVANRVFFSFQVENYQESGNISAIIDPRLGNSFTREGMEEFMQLTVRCVDSSSEKRPTMSYVVMELDRILEKEMSLTTIMGEGTPVVTLGSQLFRASK